MNQAQTAAEIAKARTKIHDQVGRLTIQVLPDRDLIGAIAELAFATGFALEMDMSINPKGDMGFDFKSRKGATVDIKATRREKGRLMVRTHKVTSDIYVLGIVDVSRETCHFVGWITANDVKCRGKREKHWDAEFWCVEQKFLTPFNGVRLH